MTSSSPCRRLPGRCCEEEYRSRRSQGSRGGLRMRIGIYGAGNIGSVHARVLAAIPGVVVAGVADSYQERAQRVAASVGARPASNLEELLSLGLDSVVVAVPNVFHADACVTALGRGVDVLCEKPMATSVEDARRVLDTVERTGRVYQIGFNRRFAPAYAGLRELVAGGMTVFSGTMKMNDGDMRNPPWFSDPRVSGGFIYDTGIHLLDAARWLLGPIKTVCCMTRSSCYPDHDDAVVLMATDSGALLAFSTCGHATWTPPTERIELFGDHKVAITEGFDRLIHAQTIGQPAVIQDFSSLPWEERLGYVQQDQAFVEAVTRRLTPPVGAEDGYRAVEMVAACYRSAANDGMPVVLGC